MAKNYEVGEKYYLPVRVEEVVNTNYGVKISFEDGAGVDTTHICEFPDVLLTADEIAIMPHTGTTEALEELKAKVASLKEENEKLKTKVERLTTWYEEANRTASEATEANDELKAKIKELRTRNAELEALLKDVTATRDEAIKQNNELIAENEHQKSACEEQKRLAQNWKENTYKLDKDNEKLKQELKGAEAAYNVVADTSIKRNNRVKTMEEVIVALVEKIRRLEGGEQ